MNQDYENLEILVIDQSPMPFLPGGQLAGKSSKRLRYQWHPYPNLPAARNLGLDETSGEIVIFLDDDASIEHDFVRAIVETYTCEDIGAVCGMTISIECQDYPAETIRLANLLGVKQPVNPRQAISVDSMIGVNMSFRRSTLDLVGRFDEAFTGSGWGEDTELTLRVRRSGYRMLLNPHIKVIHLQPSLGGCANRDPHEIERIRRERLIFLVYIYIKHVRRWPVDALRGCYGAWRAYAFNKRVVQLGLGPFLNRQVEMISAVGGVLAYLAGGRDALL